MEGGQDAGAAEPLGAGGAPATRTPRSQKTPIQKEALEAAFKSEPCIKPLDCVCMPLAHLKRKHMCK